MPRMRSARGLVVVLVLAACTAHPTDARRTAPTGPAHRLSPLGSQALDPTRGTALQSVLDGLVRLEADVPGAGAPGVTASVASATGLWSGAAGVDGAGTRLVPEAGMLVASITKTFLAAEVLLLVDQGRVDLDAPLSRYVSSPLITNEATVRQTLSMRGGFRDQSDQALGAILRAAQTSPRRHWTPAEFFAAWSAPGASPAPEPVYSSTGFQLLGLLVERVTGRPLAAALRADLFGRAGLRRIAAQDTERLDPPLAAPQAELRPCALDGYVPCRSLASIAGPAVGGIAADAATVAAWGYQLYGGRVLSASLTEQMQTPPTSDDLDTALGYALGTMVFEGLATDRAVGHLGDMPGYESILVVLPERGLSVAVLTSTTNRSADILFRTAKDLVEAMR